jgi:predicted double-glycine peptidase|uniref:Peptidase C39 domain-containing protein n=1 Tax=Gracilinema caldarium TaxID=215591 RepID=A0A7C3IIF4_9SPIR
MAGILSFLLLLQNVQSSETLRFAHVAEQGYDTSCGLSVLSDLVSRYWNCPISEETFLQEWLSLGKQGATDHEQYAISFKDMQELLALHGFASKGFRFTYDQLLKAAATYTPIVIHFADQEGHFVLCLSANDEFLVIADPAEGVYWLSQQDFQRRWQGYALLVQSSTYTKQIARLNTAVAECAAHRTALQNFSNLNSGVR